MRRRGEVVEPEQIFEHIWNAEANPFSNTIRTHINALRRALGDTAASPRYIGDGRRRGLSPVMRLPSIRPI